MIAADGLAAAYGPHPVFRDVTFRLESGEAALLCGANGAGKSTLLRILAGLTAPERGVAFPGSGCERPGYLGHAHGIYTGLTAFENLVFWGRARGAGADRHMIMEQLARFGMERYADERAAVFSRGMLQRLALARAFLGRPGVLLLDEPAAGLDAGSAGMLRCELERACRGGACALVSTHEPESFGPVAGRVFLLARGSLAEVGGMFPAEGPGEPCCA